MNNKIASTRWAIVPGSEYHTPTFAKTPDYQDCYGIYGEELLHRGILVEYPTPPTAPKWTFTIGNGVLTIKDWHKPPSRFHRWMQRLLLGVTWTETK